MRHLIWVYNFCMGTFYYILGITGLKLFNSHCCEPIKPIHHKSIEPSHEIMVLFILGKLILQMGLDVWVLVGPFVYFNTLCVRTAKVLASLQGCAGSPEPSLVAYVISTIISWAGSISDCKKNPVSKSKISSIFDNLNKNSAYKKLLKLSVVNEPFYEKMQISRHIQAVWSAPLLIVVEIILYLKLLNPNFQDSS